MRKVIIKMAIVVSMMLCASKPVYASDFAALNPRNTYCNMDMPRNVYEAAYNTLMSHAGDPASPTPVMYDIGAGYTGVEGAYMAKLLNILLGSTDVFVTADDGGRKNLMLTSSGYISKDTRSYTMRGSGGGKRGLKVGYCCNVDPAAAADKIRRIRDCAEGIAASVSGGTSSNVMKFNGTICSRCDYDYRLDGFANSEINSPYGCLVNGLATCGGYANAMMLLCYFKNIPCYSVTCLVDGTPHGRNAIYLDGRYVWSDSTYAENGGSRYVLYRDVTEEPFKTLFDYVPEGKAAHWEKSGENWIYLDASGKRMTGWLMDGGYWYYMDANGIMLTGKINESGSEYFLNDGFTDSIPFGAMCSDMMLADGRKAGSDGRVGE